MVEPPFTEAHESFRAQAREFVLGELRPHAVEWEEAGWFPNDVFAALGARGWLELKYGGDPVADAVLAEELARCGSGGLAAGIGAHVHIATPPIHGFGTDAQRARWLAPALRGELIGALAITEPDAGSDVARRGLESRALSKLGWRASDTAELAFDEVFVPREHLLGDEGRGFYLVMTNFQWERLVMALGAVGAMRRTLERAAVELRGRGQATMRGSDPTKAH